MSMTSGIVFVFWPPWITFGDTVVCVQAWAMRAWSGGSVASASRNVAGSPSWRRRSSGIGSAARLAVHRSSTRAGVRYVARRRTISDAVTSALSEP